jgi:hypothetical protein
MLPYLEGLLPHAFSGSQVIADLSQLDAFAACGVANACEHRAEECHQEGDRQMPVEYETVANCQEHQYEPSSDHSLAGRGMEELRRRGNGAKALAGWAAQPGNALLEMATTRTRAVESGLPFE